MLSVQDMQALSDKYPVEVTTFYPAFSTKGREVPKPNRIIIHFKEEAPDVWEMLMSQEAEVPAKIFGTRQVTGSGATDNRLYPVYRERLAAVNARRKEVGLEPIFD